MGTVSTGPVECTTWCYNGDGHPREMFREDQRCYSEFDYIDLTLTDGQISAHARRDVDKQPVVELHVYGSFHGPCGETDETIHLTALEAVNLVTSLTSAICHTISAGAALAEPASTRVAADGS